MSEKIDTPENIEAAPVADEAVLSSAAISVRTAVIMLLFTTAFTALMAGTYIATKTPIAASQQTEKLRVIGEVLPSDLYDNDLLQDTLELPPTPELGLNRPSTVYRARRGGQPVAMVVEAAAPDGYSGHIGLIVATRPDGEILAVRVTDHKETPGLGDYIDIKKDKNKTTPWITQFDRQGPAAVGEDQWKVKKDGGKFDQRAGATISARAVTNAVGRAVRYIAAHQDELLAGGAVGNQKSPAQYPNKLTPVGKS